MDFFVLQIPISVEKVISIKTLCKKNTRYKVINMVNTVSNKNKVTRTSLAQIKSLLHRFPCLKLQNKYWLNQLVLANVC